MRSNVMPQTTRHSERSEEFRWCENRWCENRWCENRWCENRWCENRWCENRWCENPFSHQPLRVLESPWRQSLPAAFYACCALLLVMAPSTASAQTSSLGERQRQVRTVPTALKAPREAPDRPRNLVYERYAWTVEKPLPPKTHRPGDLLTIIIREQRKWEADSELKTKRQFDVNSQLDAFFKPIDGGLGSTTFQRGKPNVAYGFDSKLKSQGDADREDKLTTRLTAKIIDVKPNGLLVLEGVAKITHDEEVSQVTITGTCRKEDVTADNTVLSTQIADKVLVVNNEGALRAANSRGWITKILDFLKPS